MSSQLAHSTPPRTKRLPATAAAPVATITGLGSVVPDTVLTNADLEKMVETSNEWIVERTGISARRLAAPDQAASDLAAEAARLALQDAGVAPEDVDLILVSTATPDHLFPSTACLVQRAIGASKAAAMDISAACTGFIYGLGVAEGFLATRRADTVLLIGAECLSRLTDYEDRGTCILFGDGAGAMVLRRPGEVSSAGADAPGNDTRGRGPSAANAAPAATPADGRSGLLSVFLASDGNGADLLSLPAGGSRRPASAETVAQRLHYIKMDGPEVFRFAVGAMITSFKESVKRAGLSLADIDLLVPHQANARIVDAAVRFMRVSPDKVFHTIADYGNMSSASIPISLDEARRQGRLSPGNTVALAAFGAGLTYGGAVLRWDGGGNQE